MKRRRYIGAANKGGIEFTDLSTSNLNAQQAGMLYGKTPSGEIFEQIVWSSDAANVYFFRYDLEQIEALADGLGVVVTFLMEGTHYAIGYNSDDTLQFKPLTTASALDNHYKWICESNNGFQLKNVFDETKYLYVTSSGELKVQTGAGAGGFSLDDNYRAKYKYYNSGSIYYAARYNSSTLYELADSNYTAKIYTQDATIEADEHYALGLLVYTDYIYTLHPTSTSDGSINGSNKWLVLHNNTSTSYYAVGLSGTSINIYGLGSPSSVDADGSLHFTFFEVDSMSDYCLNVNGSNGNYTIQFSSNNYFLQAPASNLGDRKKGKFTANANKSVITYDETNGVYVTALSARTFGVSTMTSGLTVTSYSNSTQNGGTTILFRYDGSAWSPYYGSLNAGETYAIAIRQAPADPDNLGAVTADYYLVGYDGTDMTHHNFSTFADITITSDCEFAATQGTYGVGLTSNNKGLNVNNEYLAMLDVSADWVYIGDSTTPENSRLWSVVNQTVTYYPEYANSDLEANTSATETTAECYLVQNGKIQTLVDELVNGETYVIVFVDSGNHYAACVSGTDIVPVLFVDKLPSKLPAAYQFTAETSGQGFLLKQNNQAMGVATNAKLTLGYNAVWTYTGGTT